MLAVYLDHWTAMSADQRRNHIMRLLDLLDVSDHEKRMSAVCALLYIAQGMSKHSNVCYIANAHIQVAVECCVGKYLQGLLANCQQ
jgi:hypothetical protein